MPSSSPNRKPGAASAPDRHEEESGPDGTQASGTSMANGGETPGEESSALLGAVREPQRLHPLTLLLRVGASLPPLLLILLPTLQNPSSQNVFSVVLTIIYGVVALPAIVLQYLRFSYRITPKQIVIQKGVIKRQNRSIPIERVQNIQIERNLVARFIGLAKVKIETAGSSATEASLEYVGLSDAHEIRQAVRSFQHRPVQSATEGAADGEDDESASSRKTLFAMSLSDVLLSGAFRFSLLYIALMFSALELVDPETIMQRLLRSQGRIDQLTSVMTAHPVLTVLATIAVAGLFGWITGILMHVARYYRFHLWRDGDKLRKKHGLFTVTEGTIPLEKVQALILRTNPIMRAFGWYELKVQTIGQDVDEQGHRVIAPFAQYDRILSLASRVRTFKLPDSFGSVSPITIRRRFFRYSVALTAAILPTAYFWPVDWPHPAGTALPWWAFALLPVVLIIAILQYWNHDYATRDDGLYIRRGVLSHYLWIIPLEKFHVFHATASVFQQRLGLKTLFVDTAGAATFAYPEVIDLPADEADAQLERLYQRFQSLYRSRIRRETGDPQARLDEQDRPRLPVDGNEN